MILQCSACAVAACISPCNRCVAGHDGVDMVVFLIKLPRIPFLAGRLLVLISTQGCRVCFDVLYK